MKYLTPLIFIFILQACGPKTLLTETTEIDGGKWVFSDSRSVSCEVSDTLTPHNFHILLRHGATYKYQNLILYFKLYYPNNTYTIDTIDCPLADKSGRWYGSGIGDLLDNRIMFKRNVQFPMTGTYNFELQHAMRSDTVDEIYDIGLLIEGASN